MDKQQFVSSAPMYYALAICVYFMKHTLPAYENEIKNEFVSFDEDNDIAPSYNLGKPLILRRAFEWLTAAGMIEPLLDDFGPPVFRLTDGFHDIYHELIQERSSPFYKYDAVHDKRGWLESALRNLNAAYDELGVTDEDFQAPDRDWAPLPLDRSEPQLATAIGALEEVVEQVRSDNGYNATLPEERNYVLSTLSLAVKELKESASTSFAYIRTFALDPLAKLITRFKDAALGMAASAAKEAIVEFLKQHGIKILETLFK